MLLGLLMALGSASTALGQTTSPNNAPRTYSLYPRDVINIAVFDEPDLSTVQPLDGDGYVQVPLLGKVRVSGLTVRQTEDLLERMYKDADILLNPQITVVISEYGAKQVHVFGEVNSPGTKPFPKDVVSMDIVEVISMAGDFTDLASEDDVTITRVNEQGVEERIVIDVSRLISGKRLRTEEQRRRSQVYPGDTIYVRERFF